MLIKALLAAAAVSSIAGAAFAAPTPDSDKGQDVTAQSTPTEPSQKTSTDNSVPATAVTPSANVASSTTTTDSTGATVTTELITNGPVPDTPQNRARYGQPLSHAGRATAPKGN